DGQQLQSAQQLRPWFHQQVLVGSGELHQDLRPLPLAVLAYRWIYGNAIAQAQAAVLNHSLEQGFDLTRGRDFVLYRHATYSCTRKAGTRRTRGDLMLPRLRPQNTGPARFGPATSLLSVGPAFPPWRASPFRNGCDSAPTAARWR